MATTVTVKGQVTLPKHIREAAGIKPGDRVEVRAVEGSIVVEKVDTRTAEDRKAEVEVLRRRLDALRAQGVRPLLSADELMQLTRGDD